MEKRDTDNHDEFIMIIKEISNLFKSGNCSHSLTNYELMVLRLISIQEYENKKPYMARDIAESIGISSPALSRILKNLEKKELIHRTIPDNNRRTAFFELTDKAREIYGKELLKVKHLINQIEDDMGHEDFSLLIQLTKKLIVSIRKIHGGYTVC